MKLKPLADRVIVKQVEAEEETTDNKRIRSENGSETNEIRRRCEGGDRQWPLAAFPRGQSDSRPPRAQCGSAKIFRQPAYHQGRCDRLQGDRAPTAFRKYGC